MSSPYAKHLKELRTQRGFSQAELAGRLGIHRVTYMDIEKGKREPSLSEAEKLAAILGVPLKAMGEGVLENYDKYKQMILAIIGKAAGSDGCIPKTKLAKLVYLADFAWFYKHLRSMSGMPYRKIKFGPVPDAYFRAIDELYEEGKIDIRNTEGGAFLISQTRPGQKEALAALSPEESKLIADIAHKWKRKNTREIVAFTHRQLPYAVCADNEIIPYELITQENPDDVY